MEFELLRNWGDLEKGQKVTIYDQSVIDEALRVGLFKTPKSKTSKEETKQEK